MEPWPFEHAEEWADAGAMDEMLAETTGASEVEEWQTEEGTHEGSGTAEAGDDPEGRGQRTGGWHPLKRKRSDSEREDSSDYSRGSEGSEEEEERQRSRSSASSGPRELAEGSNEEEERRDRQRSRSSVSGVPQESGEGRDTRRVRQESAQISFEERKNLAERVRAFLEKAGPPGTEVSYTQLSLALEVDEAHLRKVLWKMRRPFARTQWTVGLKLKGDIGGRNKIRRENEELPQKVLELLWQEGPPGKKVPFSFLSDRLQVSRNRLCHVLKRSDGFQRGKYAVSTSIPPPEGQPPPSSEASKKFQKEGAMPKDETVAQDFVKKLLEKGGVVTLDSAYAQFMAEGRGEQRPNLTCLGFFVRCIEKVFTSEPDLQLRPREDKEKKKKAKKVKKEKTTEKKESRKERKQQRAEKRHEPRCVEKASASELPAAAVLRDFFEEHPEGLAMDSLGTKLMARLKVQTVKAACGGKKLGAFLRELGYIVTPKQVFRPDSPRDS